VISHISALPEGIIPQTSVAGITQRKNMSSRTVRSRRQKHSVAGAFLLSPHTATRRAASSTAQAEIEILIAAAPASHGGPEAGFNLASPSAATAAHGIAPDCRNGQSNSWAVPAFRTARSAFLDREKAKTKRYRKEPRNARFRRLSR
jgi:hypothetical protein